MPGLSVITVAGVWGSMGLVGGPRVSGGCSGHRWRPYRVECTGSLPTSEVKRRRARLVLGWGTAREDLRVLPAFCAVCLWCLFFPPLGCCGFQCFDSRSAVAQWLACWAHNPKVRGSKPRCAISRCRFRCWAVFAVVVLGGIRPGVVGGFGSELLLPALSLNNHPSLTPQSSV